MSYNPITDFIALLRNTSGGVRAERMPGLDFLVAGLARAEMFLLWTGSTAPTVNKASTVWLLPASPSSVAEGAVFLYNNITAEYEPATPILWAALFAAAGQFTRFQAVITPVGIVGISTTLLAIERAAPVTTVLDLPSVVARSATPLQIVDWSTGVVGHEVILTPDGAETVMKQPTFSLFSTAVQPAGATLYPSPNLNAWIIAP